MILQALCEYYDRKIEQGKMAPDGFIEKNVDFVVYLEKDGSYKDIGDLRESQGKRRVGKRFYVPAIGKQAQKHTNSGKDANLLWDNSAFALGLGNKGDAKLRAFIDTIRAFYPSPPEDVKTLLLFLENEEERNTALERMFSNDSFAKDLASGAPVVSFRIGGGQIVFEEAHVKQAMLKKDTAGGNAGVCLVSGRENVPIALTHSVIKGVVGGQSSGCNLVSFNAASFCSYGLEQSLNAPTNEVAASAYAKALQALIDSEDNRVRIADATVVSWAQLSDIPEVEALEQGMAGIFSDPPKEDPDRNVLQVKGLLEAIESGKYTKPLGNFYILGLAPNAARLSVRYWEFGPVGLFAERIRQHFDDFSIVHAPHEPLYLSLAQILRSTALEYKISNVPPNIAGDVVRSVLSGISYPYTLFNLTIRRIRAERQVTRARAAILKAYINREIRLRKKSYEEAKEITMGLDKTNMNIGYKLGRLFAVLERIQEDALGKLNAGIRDRFYGAASSTPATVFSRLLQLKNHHIDKLGEGLAVVRERTIGEIMDGIDGFPAHLTLEQQGNFAIGYYHQRQDFYTKSTDKKEGE